MNRELVEQHDDDNWITPEKSLFRTRIPRPANARVHLVLAFVMFVAALLIAIFFAER